MFQRSFQRLKWRNCSLSPIFFSKRQVQRAAGLRKQLQRAGRRGTGLSAEENELRCVAAGIDDVREKDWRRRWRDLLIDRPKRCDNRVAALICVLPKRNNRN